jgi:hypothetical protein
MPEKPIKKNRMELVNMKVHFTFGVQNEEWD